MAKQTQDALDALASGDPKDVIALLFWRERFRNPDMSLHITKEDVEKFRASCAFLNVEPQVSIYRPEGRPAQEAVPAIQASPGKAAQRGIPARPAEPPRPYVFVGVTDAQGNTLKPIENDEEDAQRRDDANNVRRWKDKAPMLASLLTGMMQSGTFSNAEIAEAVEALRVLSRAV